MVVKSSKTISRNAACPCGSGKKFKRCCLRDEIKAKPTEGLPRTSLLLAPRFADGMFPSPSNSNQNRAEASKLVFCQVPLENGKFLVLTLAYTVAYLQRNQLRPGDILAINLSEIDFCGQAFVINIQDASMKATFEGELLVVIERQHEGDQGVMVYGKGPMAQQVLDQRRERSREIVLRMDKPDGSCTDITLLRSIAWMESNEVEIGKDVFLYLPEMSALGFARVLAIHPCPPLELDHGSRTRLVTGTFRHTSGEVYHLKLASEHLPLGVTDSHPFWSVSQGRWVSVVDLKIGETLKTITGTTVVESLEKQPGFAPVYNIEVEGDHVYRVGESGVLVHNASQAIPSNCSPCDQGQFSPPNQTARFEHIYPDGGLVVIWGKPQDTGVAAHRLGVIEVCEQMVRNKGYDNIHLNRPYHAMPGFGQSGSIVVKRADIVGYRHGTDAIDIIEVASLSDDSDDLLARIKPAWEILPENRRGNLIVFSPNGRNIERAFP